MPDLRYKKVLDLPVLLHPHASDLDLAHRRYHLQPAAIDAALREIGAVIDAGGRKPKSLSVTADLNRRVTDLAQRHATTQWQIVSALLCLAAFDQLCPTYTERSPILPQPSRR
ncbi:hypothetical protein FHW79_006072 [Azospirillum sp. OGB3]|uniref:hypothetical protein n=1 Tax=Azospirillum sp. OGB3 TaxID=2587012 RepID=UPI0016063C67|nr:hypothetical protein [Azospirillum sp. OGB3]MBB3268397.1 hypothetical protein [Azospirillum sp. OGB3]